MFCQVLGGAHLLPTRQRVGSRLHLRAGLQPAPRCACTAACAAWRPGGPLASSWGSPASCGRPRVCSPARPGLPGRRVTARAERQARSLADTCRRPDDRDEETSALSTSDRCTPAVPGAAKSTQGVAALGGAPLAVLSLADLRQHVTWDNLKNARKALKQQYDRLHYGEILPPIGSLRMSYARMLELLAERKIKRLIVLADGKLAIAEVIYEEFASDYMQLPQFDREDPTVMYYPEKPEWQIERFRYYVELPGDFWENSDVMDVIKMNQPNWHDASGRAPYEMLLRDNEVTTELQVLDPTEGYTFLNQYWGQLFPILVLIGTRYALGGAQWLVNRFTKKPKSKMEQMAEQFGKHRARVFNIGESKAETGVRYSDVAGIDAVKADFKVAMDMVLGDQAFAAIGARPPRGILLEGPPGTGKTLLAKAMAGEAGIPFFSANGAEFVEMFQGIAAARIRNLFKAAREVAPAIIFIDEVDAIGKARGQGGGDSGTAEREQGLLQLLCEMDGFKRNDKIMVVGATNRAGLLDDALLRPGRFDRVIYMGLPSTSNRFKILQVHARNKPVARGGNDVWEEDALLHQVAELTIGYSGAELANLLNEAAILMVRAKYAHKDEIDLEIMMEAMEKVKLGLPQAPLADSPAKQRLALVEAGRAVAAVLTRGLPPLDNVSLQPRGGHIARMLFVPQDFGQEGAAWHRLAAAEGAQAGLAQGDGPRGGTFEFCADLLVPLYAGRAAEEVLFGRQGATLATAKEVSRAGLVAHWLVANSTLHPSLRNLPIKYNMRLGGRPDPTLQGTAPMLEALTLEMLRAAHRRALRLVAERRPVIEQVAQELCTNKSPPETVQGSRIVELLSSTPLAPVDPAIFCWDSQPADSQPARVDGPASTPPRSCGSIAFSGNGSGRSGRASFTARSNGSVQPASAGEAAGSNGAGPGGALGGGQRDADPLADLRVAPDQLRSAAEAVVGRLDLAQLIGPAAASATAEQARALLADEELVARLAAVGAYATDPAAPFPPPPRDIPEFAGFTLDAWVQQDRPVIDVGQ